MDMFQNPVVWIAASFVLFVLLTYKKIWLFVTRALDERSAKIKAELDQARELRLEAERVLADYQRRQAEYLKEAEQMLQKARQDADALSQSAEQELTAELEARMKHALDRIAQEEERAIQDVRNHVVDIALAAARQIIIDQSKQVSKDDLIKLALADIERKIH